MLARCRTMTHSILRDICQEEITSSVGQTLGCQGGSVYITQLSDSWKRGRTRGEGKGYTGNSLQRYEAGTYASGTGRNSLVPTWGSAREWAASASQASWEGNPAWRLSSVPQWSNPGSPQVALRFWRGEISNSH